MLEYTIYTDGAYSSLRNQGGCGVVILKNEQVIKTFSKCYMQTTNNRMEILAVILGLSMIRNAETINIITDSQYVIGCASKGWKRNKNTDLWKLYDEQKIRLENTKIKFQHVKGHNGDKYNSMCDKLAVDASHETNILNNERNN